MVLAWYMDSEDDVDQREQHQLNPPQFVNLEDLEKLGVLYWKIDVNNLDGDALFNTIREERGYQYSDIITIAKETLPNYDEKIKMFFKEHLHADEEIRLVVEGSGYFDVRNEKDTWIRIQMDAGDMIVLPAGMYHRFTLDTKNYIKAMRLFCGEPVWTAINRPADDHPNRQKYLNQFIMAC